MAREASVDPVGSVPELNAMFGRTPRLAAFALLLAVGSVYWLHACWRLLAGGHALAGTTSYGATWGLTVANIVHVIGISHVGIAISAAVRLLRLERYRNVARLAELVTLIALFLAVINITLDVGRPDRFLVLTFLHGRWYAPMVWSMTVIFLYFLASATYLYLSLRPDLAWLGANGRRFRGLYRALALGYVGTGSERRRHERTLYWMALALLPIMVSVHSVYGLVFGLLAAKAGWFNPLQAPYFVLGAVVSGFSAILVIAAILRRAFAWEEILGDRVFRTFAAVLAFVLFLYLYFMGSEQITAQYAAPLAERAVSDELLFGDWAWRFWVTTLVGLVLPFAFLLVQALRGRMHLGATAAAALLVNLAMLTKRVLLVVPAQYHPRLDLPRPSVPYEPTHVEIVATFGAYAFGALLLVGLLKLLPVVGLPVPAGAERDEPPDRSRPRSVTVFATLLLAVALIAWGWLTRGQDYASPKWLVGLALLVAVPLEVCLLGTKGESS